MCQGSATTAKADFPDSTLKTVKGGASNSGAKALANSFAGAEYVTLNLVAPDTTVYTQNYTEWTIDTSTGVVTVKLTADNTTGEAWLNDYNDGAWKDFLAKYKTVITEVHFENVDGRADITVLKAGIAGCTELTKIVYPATVTKPIARSAGGWAYTSNPKLATFGPVGTPEGVCDLSAATAFGNTTSAFQNAAFKKVIAPAKLSVYWATNAFKGCTSLEEVILGVGTKQLSDGMFNGCSSLKKIIFLNAGIDASKVSYITEATFGGCHDDLVFYVPVDAGTGEEGMIGIANKWNIPYIYHNGKGGTLFTYAEGGIEWSITNDGVVTVHPTAENEDGVLDFANPYISDEQREEGATENAWQIFLSKGNNVVKKVVIENVEGRADVTALKGSISFETLTSITFPETVDTILGRADGGYCYNGKALTTFGPEGTPEGTCDLSGIDLENADFQDGYYFRSMFNGADFTTVVLGEELSSVAESMFANCDMIEEVTIPGSVMNIFTKAFQNCTALTTVNVLGDPQIAADAFEGCTALAALNALPGTAAAAFAAANELSCTVPEGAVPKSINVLDFTGFGIRDSKYNGIRAEFSYNKKAAEEWAALGFNIVEYGAIVSTAANRAEFGTELTLDGGEYVTANERIVKKAIYKGDVYVNKILEIAEDETTFALSLVNISEDNYQTDVYMCGYTVFANAKGDVIITYTEYANEDFVETNLYDLTKFAVDSGIVSADNPIAKPVLDSVPEPEPALPPEEE